MARLTEELRELIIDRVGRFNTDVLVGWEAGLQGKQRIGGRLYDRHPPDYFVESRRNDWDAGYRAALRERDRASLRREVTFCGHNGTESVIVRRKGWSVRRGEVVTQLERKGCYGLVLVQYWRGSEIVRSVNCQI